MTPPRAVLDACVLFPAPLRDTLLRTAEHGLYQALWTSTILEEVRRNLVEQRRVRPEQAQRLIAVLQAALPAALVTGYEVWIPSMTNNPKDRHVAAAAVESGADIIVTSNLRDFPETALARWGIEVQSPDEFLAHFFSQEPALMAQVVVEQAHDLRNPARTVHAVLDMLALQAPQFAQLVREYLARMPSL